jgi:hypothetical protein
MYYFLQYILFSSHYELHYAIYRMSPEAILGQKRLMIMGPILESYGDRDGNLKHRMILKLFIIHLVSYLLEKKLYSSV